MPPLHHHSRHHANDGVDLEYELCRLTSKYEAQGFTHYFYLEKGLLVCDDYNMALYHPAIDVHEHHYYPPKQGIPYGFCLYAITVRNASCVFKGIFLLPQGFFTPAQVSRDIDCQLQLHHLHPQIFKADEK
jgi:hypothetical protein